MEKLLVKWAPGFTTTMAPPGTSFTNMYNLNQQTDYGMDK